MEISTVNNPSQKTKIIGANTPTDVMVGAFLSKDKVKEVFEKRFGDHKDTRTAQQWKQLCKVYGKAVVMRIDGVNAQELKRKLKGKK